MFCKKCGAEAPEGSLFCPKCGAQLQPAGPESEAEVPSHDVEELQKAAEAAGSQVPAEGQVPAGIVCPKCGSADLAIERFTWWGGLLGAALANRLKCRSCGYKFKINR